MQRRLFLGLISLLSAMALAEGATRLWLKVEGRSYERASAEQAIRSTLDAVSGLTAGVMTEASAPGKRRGPEYELQPYSGYVHRTVAKRTAKIVERFRSEEKEDAYVVVSQGGSVAAGFQGEGLEILLKSLADSGATGGREVRVYGLSVPGYKQPQQLTQLAYLLSQGCHPDMVLNLDGLNELRIGSGNLRAGLEPSFPSRGHWGSLLAAQDIDGTGLDDLLRIHQAQQETLELGKRILERGDCASALTGTLALSRLARSQEQWALAQADLIDSRTERQKSKGAVGYKASPEGRDAVLEAVACWKRSSLAMHQLCEARGIRYVHVLQPTLHDESSKVMSEEERRVGIDKDGLHPAVVRGYPLLREALAELRDRGVEALDACSAFKEMPQTIYVDSCHFTQEGNRILARNIARMMGLPEPSEPPDNESDATQDK